MQEMGAGILIISDGVLYWACEAGAEVLVNGRAGTRKCFIDHGRSMFKRNSHPIVERAPGMVGTAEAADVRAAGSDAERSTALEQDEATWPRQRSAFHSLLVHPGSWQRLPPPGRNRSAKV